MSFQGDPFRTLGVAPDASLNEIKSAYRRLVKQYHPDAAGERALPRFLAIQAAYERLVDGEGHLRATSGPTRHAAPTPTEQWRADPTRARASRDAWRARRTGGQAGAGGTGTGTRGPGGSRSSSGAGAAGGFGWAKPGAGARRPAGEAADGGAATGGTPGGATGETTGETTGGTTGGTTGETTGGAGGSAGTGSTSGGTTDGPARTAGGSPRRDRPRREHHARRGPRKATPGSTTYDEAAELPLDPEWDGGAWYGPSSGTYWTLNPREYADPRKHGPEYQARAWRATQAQRAGLASDPSDPLDDPTPSPAASTDAAGEAPHWRWTDGDATHTDGGAEWGTGDWTYDDAAVGPEPGDRRRGDPPSATGPATMPGEAAPDLESIVRRFSPRSLLALARRRDRRWRLLLALAGWPPIGYAAGSLATQVTACAPASPTCMESLAILPLILQPLVLVTLFLVPTAAAIAAFAGLVTLAAALPVAAILSVTGASAGSPASPVLGALAAVTYVAALVAAAASVWRVPDEVGTGPPET